DRGPGAVADRLVAGELLPDALDQLARVPLGQRLVEAALVAEVAVEDRLADPRLGGDRGHRRLRALAPADPVGGLQQGPAAAGIAPGPRPAPRTAHPPNGTRE